MNVSVPERPAPPAARFDDAVASQAPPGLPGRVREARRERQMTFA